MVEQRLFIKNRLEAEMKRKKLGEGIRHFYVQAKARNVIPKEYQKGIEWFIKSVKEFDQ